MKINGSDFTLIDYTIFGGSKFDSVNDMFVDSEGRAYICGRTDSDDFPVENGFCETIHGAQDCYIICLDTKNQDVLFSTYLGGNYSEIANSIFVDFEGSVYITGYTNSFYFPKINSYGNLTGVSSVFVTKMNSTGNGLFYSSIIGGSRAEEGYAITVDPHGNAYVAGITVSSDFPTINAFEATSDDLAYFGPNDGFVFCLNSTGNGLIFSTFIGGTDSEILNDITLDSNNDVWVCGATESDDFPVVGNFQGNQDGEDGFLFELSSNGSVLLYSTYIGGDGDFERCNSLGIDERDNIFVCGRTSSANFELFRAYNSYYTTPTEYKTKGFIMKISSEKSMLYSTLIGGSGSESCNSLCVGTNGAILVGGASTSSNFPLKRALSGPASDIARYMDSFALILLDISDEDGDNIPNWWEQVNGYDPLNPNAPMIEILQWNAPVILIGISLTLFVIVLVLRRHSIKSWIGRRKSGSDFQPTIEKRNE